MEQSVPAPVPAPEPASTEVPVLPPAATTPVPVPAPALSSAASPAASPAAPPANAPAPAAPAARPLADAPPKATPPATVAKEKKKRWGFEDMKIRPIPSQGLNEYSKKKVMHKDGTSMTADWGEEWPSRGESVQQTVARICRQNPRNAWCERYGYIE